MSISATLPTSGDMSLLDSGSEGSSGMSARQREFARAYVLNGGNATKAAATAGYSDADLAKAGQRCALNPKIQAEVRRLSVANGAMLLPILMRRAFEIAMDPETPARDALAGVFGLADRLGMAPPKGNMQVNIGSQVNNGSSQTLIQQIWDARQQRLGSSAGASSDILPAMTDMDGALGAGLIDHASDANGMPLDLVGDRTPGGVSSQRVPSPASINTSPSPSPIAIPVENGDGEFQPEENDDDSRPTRTDSDISSSRADVAGSGSVVSAARIGDDAGSAGEEAAAGGASVAGSSVGLSVDRRLPPLAAGVADGSGRDDGEGSAAEGGGSADATAAWRSVAAGDRGRVSADGGYRSDAGADGGRAESVASVDGGSVLGRSGPRTFDYD